MKSLHLPVITLFFALLAVFNPLRGAIVGLPETAQKISLLEHSELFIDRGALRTFTEMRRSPVLFRAYGKPFINLGDTTDTALWIRFTLNNESNSSLERMLRIDNHLLDTITLYDNRGSETTVGLQATPPFDGIIDFHFPVTLQPHEARTYWLRILSNSSATYFHLSLERTDRLWYETNRHQLLLTIFFTLLTTLIVYNILIFLFVRNMVYLYFALTLGAVIINHIAYTGMHLLPLPEFLVPGKLTIYDHPSTYRFAAMLLFTALFAYEFLQLRHHRRITLLLAIQAAAIVPIAFVSSGSLFPLLFAGLLLMLYLFTTSLYQGFMLERNSFYYVFGWGFYLAGYLYFLMHHQGICCVEGPGSYFYEISVSCAALIFSAVLARQLGTAKNMEKTLNAQRALLRELHHRVKNNMQFIISLYRLKLSQGLDVAQRRKLKEAESGVRAVARIHEILYDGGRQTRIDAAPVLREIAQTLRDGIGGTEKVDVHLEGSAALDMEQAISLGIIVNELLSNAFKHAFGTQRGRITMRFDTGKKGYVQFVFEDSGTGYDAEREGRGFGLDLVRSLAENTLGATWSADTSGPTRYTLTWKI